MKVCSRPVVITVRGKVTPVELFVLAAAIAGAGIIAKKKKK